EPDLQGTYSNRTITPFERPANVAGREFFTAEEIAALEKTASDRSVDEGRQRGTTADVGSAYNEFWWDRGRKVTTTRTSLVVDPPDGRVPPLTREAQARGGQGGRGGNRNGGADHWTDRSLFERCITRGMPGDEPERIQQQQPHHPGPRRVRGCRRDARGRACHPDRRAPACEQDDPQLDGRLGR